MRKLALLIFLVSIACLSTQAKGRQFYEIKIYSIHSSEQESRLDSYLQNAYLPAMHKMGIASIGVFKPRKDSDDAGKKIYVLTPLSSQAQLLSIQSKLEKDAAYQAAGADYINAAHDNPAYDRYETIVLQAFTDNPKLNLPKLTGPKSERFYELRSYESATEKQYRNKVHMFNEGGEVALFKKLNFNAVFYGEVISGSHMPNLMYMTTFENKADRDAHWKAFGEAPEWNTMKVLPIYQNNMNKNTQFNLFPTDYSDI